MNDPRVQAIFKRSRHNNLSFFISSQDYYELPERTIRDEGNIYHIFKPNSFRDMRNPFQDKAFMDMTLNELIYLTKDCWDKENWPSANDMTKDENTGKYRLGLFRLLNPDISPFEINKLSMYLNVTQQDLIIFRKLAEQQKNHWAIKIKNRFL